MVDPNTEIFLLGGSGNVIRSSGEFSKNHLNLVDGKTLIKHSLGATVWK